MGHERMRKQINVSLKWDQLLRLERIWRKEYDRFQTITECAEELICERIHQIEQSNQRRPDNG